MGSGGRRRAGKDFGQGWGSAADAPPDNDGDRTSDLNDPDDDNDGRSDTTDPFAVDPDNGKTTSLPVTYTWDNAGTTRTREPSTRAGC